MRELGSGKSHGVLFIVASSVAFRRQDTNEDAARPHTFLGILAQAGLGNAMGRCRGLSALGRGHVGGM